MADEPTTYDHRALYRVDLYYASDDGIRRYLGRWDGEAVSKRDARQKAMDALWDERLDATAHAVIRRTSDTGAARAQRMARNQAIRQNGLVVLRWLDQQADTLRRSLGLYARGEIVTWYEQPGGKLEYTVTADGYGQFELCAYEGRNPNDRLVHHTATYEDEEAAWRAAMRLGTHGVAWADRDQPIIDEDEVPEEMGTSDSSS